MDFKKLLQDLQTVLDRGVALVKEYEQKLREVKEESANYQKLKSDLAAQKEAMQAREAACQKVENVQALHKDATARHDAANLRVNAAAEAEKALKQHTAEEHAKLDQKRQLCAKEAENLEKRKKHLDDEVTARVDDFLIKNGFKKPGDAAK